MRVEAQTSAAWFTALRHPSGAGLSLGLVVRFLSRLNWWV